MRFLPHSYYLKIAFVLSFMGLSVAVSATDLVEVLPVTNKILALRFDDGHVDYGQTEWTNNVYYEPLDSASAATLTNYRITSSDDGNYAAFKNPLFAGRKSKGADFNSLYRDVKYILEHWVYIELPTPMVAGKTYTLTLSHLSTNRTTFTFTFNPIVLRSPTVHVNQIGFTAEAPKYAYLSQWLGAFTNGTNVAAGKMDLDSYVGKSFQVVRVSDGAPVYSGTIAKRKDYQDGSPQTNNPNDGSPFWWVCGCDMWQNFTFSDVLEADFSSVTAPATTK